MTTRKAGSPAAACTDRAPIAPPAHFLKRIARRIVLHAASHGRITWFVAFVILNRIGSAE